MTTLTVPDTSSDIINRITIAADQLYEEASRNAFPNVDSVRRKARVNMNDASNVMRAWRRAQTVGVLPASASIPGAVTDASQALVATIWLAATNAADATLRTEQASWAEERSEAEACRKQLATAFDQLSDELSLAQQHIVVLEQALKSKTLELQSASATIEALQDHNTEVEARAAMSEMRTSEISNRAEDLRLELSRAHATADEDRLESRRRLAATDVSITRLRDELQQLSEREAVAREELAYLRGKVGAVDSDRPGPAISLQAKGDVESKAMNARNLNTPGQQIA
jgi:colicin import membrane protein